jgi:hypothetical protein
MALQHLRSSTANKRPTPGAMSDGQLALNTNLVSPGLFFKDSNGDLVKVGPVHVGTTAPNVTPGAGGQAGNSKGEQWLDTSSSRYVFKIWDGTAWRSEDGEFVNVSGDTMTGALGIIAGTAAAPGVFFSGDPNTGIYSPGADQLAVATNGTGRLFVDASGNVGVGVASPASLEPGARNLVVGSGSGNNGLSIYSGTADQGIIYFADGTTTAQKYTGFIAYDHNINAMRFGTNDGNERLRISSAGLVGIGTSLPGALLHIEGAGSTVNQRIFTSDNVLNATASLTFGTTPGARSKAAIQMVNSNTGNAAGDLSLLTDSGVSGLVSRLYITSAGNVGIGNTTGLGGTLGVSGHISLSGNGTGARYLALLGETNTYAGSYVLQAGGGSASYGGAITMYGNSHATYPGSVYIGTSASSGGSIIFGTENAVDPANEKVRIDPSGNVGINTASPSGKLHVVGVSGTSIIRAVGADAEGNADVEIFSTGSTGNSRLYFSDTAAQSGSIIYNHNTNSLLFGTAGSEKARLDASGRLLIGTSTSNDLSGFTANVQSEGGASAGGLVAWCNASSSFGSYLALGKSRGITPGSNTIVQVNDNLGGIYFFGADGTDRGSWGAQISAQVDGTPGANDMPGRLTFSTTADGASSPTERMRIQSTGKTTIFAASGQNVLGVHTAAAAGATDYAFYVGSSATSTTAFSATNLGIFTNGNVVNTNNSYGAISDIKFKENIVDATSQWSDIKALQVRKYNFKEGQTHTQIGLVAQEVELVSPGLVIESPDRDEDGNDLGTVTKSVNYSVLYMKAVKALQEAMERIEQLEAAVTALQQS